MTPRSVAGFNPRNEFARQLAERNQTLSGGSSSSSQQHPNKKLRTSAPKGSRLAEGYVDRAKQRQAQEEADERERRLKELEERYKKEEIEKEEYERLRAEIIGGGGGLETAHLVKGLDFKLLERVRRGEVDVFGEKQGDGSKSPEPEENHHETEENDEQLAGAGNDDDQDPDALLEQLESASVKAKEKDPAQKKKKGEFATTTALHPGAKKTRNQILAELKAARAVAKAKEESSLGSRFKKIGPQKKLASTRIERDDRGNEIMIIVDEDGNERRKVRRVDTQKTREEQEKEREALEKGQVLGMDVPEYYRKLEEEKKAAEKAAEEDMEPNIFDDVESDYDPLAGLESGSDSDKEEDKEDGEVEDTDQDKKDMPPPPPPKPAAAGPRNYFSESKTGLISQEEYKKPSLDDPSFRAALAKAKAISAAEKSEEERLAAEREARLRKKLLESSRDDEDLDMGFGSSRMEDDADMDDSVKTKLSEWRGDGEDEEDEYEGGGGKAGLGSGKGKRKRGGGKKGGDKNNFADVMKVIERNKKDKE